MNDDKTLESMSVDSSYTCAEVSILWKLLICFQRMDERKPPSGPSARPLAAAPPPAPASTSPAQPSPFRSVHCVRRALVREVPR